MSLEANAMQIQSFPSTLPRENSSMVKYSASLDNAEVSLKEKSLIPTEEKLLLPNSSVSFRIKCGFSVS